MTKTRSILTTALLAVAGALVAGNAVAHSGQPSYALDHHKTRPIRIHIPVYQHGPESLKLRRLVKRQRHLDLDHYRLEAVVVRNGPHSNGYATLKVGDHRSSRFFLSGYEHVRIPSPSRANDPWRLRLGPGSQVRMVTVVLSPRRYATYDYRWNRFHSHPWHRSHDHGHRAQQTAEHAAASRSGSSASRRQLLTHRHTEQRRERREEGETERAAARESEALNHEQLRRIYPRIRAHHG